MKKLLLLLFSSVLWAQNTTPNLGLTLPARGATNWDTQINGNFRLIDTAVGAQQNGAFVGAWSAATTYVKGQQVSSAGVLYSSLQSNNTNNTPASSPAFWAVMVGGVTNPISLTGSPAQVSLTDGIGGRNWQVSVGRAAINAFDIFDATDGNELIWVGSSEVRIGTATNLPVGNSSRLYVFGGANGANVDVQASTTQTDQAIIELEGSDYATHSNSVRMKYNGINALGTTMGLTNVNLGEIDCGGTCANLLIDTQTTAPIVLATNNLERARLLNSYQLNLGVAGTGSGILGFNGSTSGTATLTAPAVAGTTTNPLASSNTISAPAFQPGSNPVILAGVAAIVAKNDFTAQAANIGTTTAYAVPANAAGMYRVSGYGVITQAATTSSTLPSLSVGWTDLDTSSTGSAVNISASSTANLVGINSASATVCGCIVINAKASTNITVSSTGYASSGATSMQYAAHFKVEYLGN